MIVFEITFLSLRRRRLGFFMSIHYVLVVDEIIEVFNESI